MNQATRQGGRFRSSGRKAVSALEVMLGCFILAVGLLPVLVSVGGTGREAVFSEAQLLAHARVQALLDAQESLGWGPLAGDAWEARDLAIPALAGSAPVLPGVEAGRYAERLRAARLDDGLVAVSADVTWTLATDPAAGAPRHGVRSTRVIGRPDKGWIQRIPLRIRSTVSD